MVMWIDQGDGLKRRDYGSYEEYLSHQAAKLDEVGKDVLGKREGENRGSLTRRLARHKLVRPGTSVLCLGARLGAEVQAFRDLGCFAIGLDVNPGPQNRCVVHGDFHELQFPNDSADVIFTNCLDHVWDFTKFIDQVRRVLKPGGLLILEIVNGTEEGYLPHSYESCTWDKVDCVLSLFLGSGFEIRHQWEFGNPWPGRHVVLAMNGTMDYVVSFPKAGRTWLRVFLGKVLCDKYGLDEAGLLETKELTKVIGLMTPIDFTHDGASYGDKGSISITDDKAKYRASKVVFLTRDPKDTLVSYHLEAGKRERRAVFSGSVQEFVRDRHFGIEHFIKFHDAWAENQDVPEDFLLLRYEDLYRDPVTEFTKLLDFFGIRVDSRAVEEAVTYASFDNMQAMERRDRFNSPGLRPGNVNDPESYKVRRGKVGGYEDYLSIEDVAYIDEAMARGGCGFHRARPTQLNGTRQYESHGDVLIELINDLALSRIAEVGVHRGGTAQKVLNGCPGVTDYYMIDPWREYPVEFRGVDESSRWSQEEWDRVYDEAVRRVASHDGRVHVLRKTSSEAALEVGGESLDLVFVDALHTRDAVDVDIKTWLPKVKPGGILAGHDWWDDGGHYAEKHHGVKEAVLENFDRDSIHVGESANNWKNVWYVQKPTKRRILLITESEGVSWALRPHVENLAKMIEGPWRPEIVSWGDVKALKELPGSGTPIYVTTPRAAEQMHDWYKVSRKWMIAGWHSIREVVRWDHEFRTGEDLSEKDAAEFLRTMDEDEYRVCDAFRERLSKYPVIYSYNKRILKILDADNVVLLSPCVDTDRYRPGPTVGREPLVVGWSGNTKREPYKKDIALLKQVIELVEASPNLVFDDRACKGFTKGLKKAEMPGFYRDIDVLVITAVDEGTPRSILEAGASGVPVVTTPCGIAPEYIVSGETGYIVPRGDAQAFMEKLEYLAANRDVLTRMGQRIREVTVANWSVESRQDDWLELFEKFPPEQKPAVEPKGKEKVVKVKHPTFRFHLLGLAHLPTTRAVSPCAFTQKVVKMSQMLESLGHHVTVYGVEGSDVDCTEFVQVLSEAKRLGVYGDYDWWEDSFKHSGKDEAQQTFNQNAIEAIKIRQKPNDFLLCTMGNYQKPIADALKDMRVVEPGVGYRGFFTKFRVFESYAWMHFLYGRTKVANGGWYDAVIPNYFDPEDFPFVPREKKRNYALYMGRIIKRKGVEIAIQVTRELGIPLLMAGQGTLQNKNEGLDIKDPHVSFVGAVGPEERKTLMGRARMCFVPTYYIEPFGGVAVEAMMTGTPVLTTDWGVFSETCLHGVTGFRCRTFDHFLWAAKNIDLIEPQDCRDWATANYSMDRVKWAFQEYFEMVHDLGRKGWYEKHPERAQMDWLRKFYPRGIDVVS